MTVHIDGRQTCDAGTGLIAEGCPVVATTTPADAVNSSGRHIISGIRECVAAKVPDWMLRVLSLVRPESPLLHRLGCDLRVHLQ